VDNANQILQMQELIFSLYHRLENVKNEIRQLENQIRYLNNYVNFLTHRSNHQRLQYQRLSDEYRHLYDLFVRRI
jgi:TolA-binding protein